MLTNHRVKDWLYGISSVRPIGDHTTVVDGDTEAETLRSLFHLVTYPKEEGGSGITSNFGEWESIKACFPLHNQAVNQDLLRRLSRSILLRDKDMDDIRALFGEKVVFRSSQNGNFMLIVGTRSRSTSLLSNATPYFCCSKPYLEYSAGSL